MLYRRATIADEEETNRFDRLLVKQCVQLGVGRGEEIEGQVDAFATMVFVSTDEKKRAKGLQFRLRKSRVRLRRPVHRLQSSVNAPFLHHFLEETWKSREREKTTEFVDFVVLRERVVAPRLVLVIEVDVKDAKEERGRICHT